MENINTADIYIGVELDTASGDNDGGLHGIWYFTCEPNHGTFTTITGIRKISRSPHSSKTPDNDGNDSGSTVGRDGLGVGREGGKRLGRTRKQMDIGALIHSDLGGPRNKTPVDNPVPD